MYNVDYEIFIPFMLSVWYFSKGGLGYQICFQLLIKNTFLQKNLNKIFKKCI